MERRGEEVGRGERECKGEVKEAESVRGASRCRIAIHHNEMQSNPIQYNTSECNTVQYSAVEYSAVQYDASVCREQKKKKICREQRTGKQWQTN